MECVSCSAYIIGSPEKSIYFSYFVSSSDKAYCRELKYPPFCLCKSSLVKSLIAHYNEVFCLVFIKLNSLNLKKEKIYILLSPKRRNARMYFFKKTKCDFRWIKESPGKSPSCVCFPKIVSAK